MQTLQPFAGFDDAARAVLAELRGRLGLQAVLIVQRERGTADDGPPEPRYRVTHAAARGDAHPAGSELPWPEVAEALLVGSAPPVAPAVSAVPAYAAAVIPGRPRLGSVIGAPIRRRDGSVLGVLLGLDPAAQPPELAAELPLVELMARLLGTMLGATPRPASPPRPSFDGQTLDGGLHGLATRRLWEHAVAAEEARCRRYGNPAAIVLVDLEPALIHGGPADELVRRAAATVAAATRSHDLVAWLGRTELGVLAVECDQPALDSLVGRLQRSLDAAAVRATVTGAVRPPNGTLEQTWRQAAAPTGRTPAAP